MQDSGRSQAKSGKKTVPTSFAEVIDCLVDFVLHHQPQSADPTGKLPFKRFLHIKDSEKLNS